MIKSWCDETMNLRWEELDISMDGNGQNKYIYELNNWKSESIRGYLGLDKDLLGDCLLKWYGPKSRVYFCFSGEDLVGVVALKVDEKCYAIENIAVNPKFLNQGFGTMMLTSLKKEPERFGLEGLRGYTIVHKDNIRSLRAFEKSGFKKTKNVVMYPPDFVEIVSEESEDIDELFSKLSRGR